MRPPLLRFCLLAWTLLLVLACKGWAAQPPAVVAGTLDLRQWDAAQGIVGLDGEWEFVAGRLLGPQDAWPRGEARPIAVPGPWNAVVGQGHGFGTYRLRVLCPAGQRLALAVPWQHSATRMFANGRTVLAHGHPGATREAHVPEARLQYVNLPEAGCPELELRVQVSNFEMVRGGLFRGLQVGTPEQLWERRESALLRAQLALGAMIFLGAFTLMFIPWRRPDWGGVLFALFTFTYAVSLGLMGERPLQPWVAGLGFEAEMRLIVANWAFGPVVLVLMLRRLYPAQAGTVVPGLIVGWCAASTVLPLVTPVQVFTHSIPLLVVGGVSTGLYAVTMLGRAAWQRQRGAGLLLAGLLVLLAAGWHDSVGVKHLLASSLLPYGMLGFEAALALMMAQRFARAMSAEDLRTVEQRGRTDMLVRATQAGLSDWDGVRQELTLSERYKEMFGYPLDTPASAIPVFRDRLHPQDEPAVMALFRDQLRRRDVRDGIRHFPPLDCRMRCADGSYIWVHAEAMAICGPEGRMLRLISSFIDISESKRHETRMAAQEQALRRSHDQIAAQAELLERQNEALKENVRLREEVERIGRHDLKTPLNSIVAVPRLLREERKLGPEADELLGIVERAGYRILSMVNLSLDLYKMEQGSYIFRPDAVDLAELAHKVIAEVRMHAASKQVQLRLQAWQPPYAWAEELLCYSLLANLLKNAVEASPEGGVVTVSIEEAPEEHVRVRIHNLGAVPVAIRASFFRKYNTVGKASGTGLGTYSAWLMARVQDGQARMETSEDEGTTLTVTLRAAPAGKIPAATRHAEEDPGPQAEAVAALPPMRVLLVDDDEYNLLIVRRYLPSPPFTVDTAINGRVAVGAAELQWPDLVLMDLDMPVMGGLQAVVKLRELQRATIAPPCTMVALSSHDDEETQRSALAAGFDQYLTKPVTREAIHALLLELNMLIGEPAPAAAAAPPAPTPQPRAQDIIHIDADIHAVLPDFLVSRRQLLSQLEAAAAREERAEVRRIAHLLAGSFALYGFAWASERSRWLEASFSELPGEAVAAWSAEVRTHLDTVDIRPLPAQA